MGLRTRVGGALGGIDLGDDLKGAAAYTVIHFYFFILGLDLYTGI